MDLLNNVAKAFKIPEIRRKLIFTLLMLVVYLQWLSWD